MSKINISNTDLLKFLQKDKETWNKLYKKDGAWEKDEDITSCCSSHALELLMANLESWDFDMRPYSIAEYLVPALDKEVINAIGNWKCDDDEHNSHVKAITRFCRMESGIFEEE